MSQKPLLEPIYWKLGNTPINILPRAPFGPDACAKHEKGWNRKEGEKKKFHREKATESRKKADH